MFQIHFFGTSKIVINLIFNWIKQLKFSKFSFEIHRNLEIYKNYKMHFWEESITRRFWLKLVYLFFRHSFGYDCQRRANLHILDSTTLIFVTGNLIHFLDTATKTLVFRRSANGSGISCIAVNNTFIFQNKILHRHSFLDDQTDLYFCTIDFTLVNHKKISMKTMY